MALEVSRFWYCDWHAARDIDKAHEAVDNDLDDDPETPPMWLRVTVDRVVPNPDYMPAIDRQRNAARVMMLQERDPDLPPPTEEDLNAYVDAALAFAAVSMAPLEVERGVFCLSPERGGWLSLAGIGGFGGDPARVLQVAAASLPQPPLPPAADLAVLLVQALDVDALRTALDAPQAELAAYFAPAVRTILDVVRASRSPVGAADLERALAHAIDTTEEPTDA